MTPADFLRTVYLGDRICQSVTIDGMASRLVLRADVISRVRSATGNWDYYSQEDLVGGALVLGGLRRVTFEPPGFIPNDSINSVSVEKVGDIYRFDISVGSADEQARSTEVHIIADAECIYLEAVERPGAPITE